MNVKPVTLCIIDDVQTVVEGIKTKIDWAKHQIEIVFTAANGEEGLRLIREHKPQIILTDIRMPKQSGLDMIRQAGAEHAKVIFLSGYSDFEYAQESIRLGAFDYVLKPFTPKQIADVVLRAKRELESEQLEIDNLLELQQKVRQSMPYLREEYFRLLLQCVGNPETMRKKGEFLQIDMNDTGFLVFIVQIDDLEQDIQRLPAGEVELIRFAIHNILEESIHKHTKGIVVRENLHRLVAIVNIPDHIDMRQVAESCRQHVEQYTKKTVTIGLGTGVRRMEEIHLSYEQAKTAMSYQFYSGGNSVLHFRDMEPQGTRRPRYAAEKEIELIYCLRSGNTEGVLGQLDEIFGELSRYPVPPNPDLIIHLLYGLGFAIFRVVAEKVEGDKLSLLEGKLAAMKNGKTASLTELREALREICQLSCEWMQQQQRSDSKQLIHLAIDHIKANLGTELSIHECASIVHLSPSYFSNLFKKETGMTFMPYVTAARMERAKAMLLEGVQVQEITYALGYKDRPYFSELFKKHTGMTPTEFRQKYEETGESGT